MDTTLVEMFRHNRWANLRLLDACEGLTDAALDAGATGTYGRARDTLVHLLAAEERYTVLLGGQQPERPLRESEGFPGFAELRARAERSGDALITIATQDPHDKILRGTRGGEAYEMRAVVPLVQAINHATEHRSQVMTILTQQGVEPPDLSGWAFGEGMGYL